MTEAELRADIHSIEPIPDADRDSTGLQQMWIWAGANIAPVNWALGALGIVLKLGLWETIAVIVLGNLVGCAIFATFTVMGHKTGVNQMVLSRSVFGVRGAYLPSILMFLMTLCWIGVNTYFPVKISMAILGQFGIPDNWFVEIVVITLVMALQVGIGVYGFYAIRTFEKYTVPPTIAIMALMSILAWTRPGVVNWNLTTTLPPGAHLAMITLLMTAIGVGWGISWVTWASDYSRFVPRSVPSRTVFWYSYAGMFVPTVWLAILGATIASTTLDTDPAKIVFYPNYFAWFDESARLYFDSVGLPWEKLMEKYGIPGLPIVEAKARFLAPCRFRDEIVIESEISKWNDKTFEISHAVLNRGLRAVEGYEIRVWTNRHPEDPSRFRAIPIPAEIKAAFE